MDLQEVLFRCISAYFSLRDWFNMGSVGLFSNIMFGALSLLKEKHKEMAEKNEELLTAGEIKEISMFTDLFYELT